MKQDSIWDVYQNDENMVGHACQGAGRHRFIADRLRGGQRVLNIGVGSGTLEELLVSRGIRVSCLDPSETSITNLRSRLGLGDAARVGHSQALPFGDDSFDVVVMSEVLEHLDDETLTATLGEVKRVLVDSGRFVGTVPADEVLAQNIVVCPQCQERFHRWGHVQSFDRSRLEQTLATTFPDVDIQRVVLDELTSLNWKGKLVWAFKALQARADLRGSNQNFYFEAQH